MAILVSNQNWAIMPSCSKAVAVTKPQGGRIEDGLGKRLD